MKVDAALTANLRTVGADAAKLERLGYDGVKIAELNHDPFLPLTIAAEHTEQVELMTSVAVAFARNPMSMALLAHDLNSYANGRFVLGLGSQVRPHIERRFSMPWHKAARQMREFIEAMQAIFACWYDGTRLDFVGEYYTHTLMPDTFAPDVPEGATRPRVVLSATGPLMTKVAAEAADGMMMHPFSTAKYVTDVTLPAIEQGLAARGRSLADFELDYAPIVATGSTEEALAAAVATARDRIAFYGCTKAYQPVLDLHGWGDLTDELIALNRQHRKAEMAALIDDEILNTIAIVGEPAAVIDEMKRRLGNVISRTGLSFAALPEAQQSEMLARLKDT